MNKIKSITIVLIASLLASSLFFTSCEVDYLSDPNKPEVVPTYGLMNRVQKRLMDDTRDEWFSGRQALLWVQYWNQVNYTEEDRYQYRETTNQGGWDDLYGNAQDLHDILTINAASDVPNPNEIAGARIMLCYIYSLATQVWGDVPYYSYGSENENFQANSMKDKGIFAPVYASQEEIYKDILKELKEAADMIDGPVFPNGDNFFGGEPDQWKKFANSLRLRIANRIKGVYPPAEAIITEVSANVMESNADNAGVTYEANALNASPMYRAFYVDNRTDFAPSFSFVELLKGNRGPFTADPRLAIYADENKDGFITGIPLTSANSEVVAFTWESLPGSKILSLTYTEIYMEYAEVCFILAENNGWSQEWYENGVRASMEKWGVDEAAIADYIAALPAATEETVMTQKYIALYMQPYEAWSEYRRTGFPHTLVMPGETYDYTWQYLDPDGAVVDTTASFTFTPIGGLTDLPGRNKYLSNESSVNGANVSSAASAIGGDEQSTKLWWAK